MILDVTVKMEDADLKRMQIYKIWSHICNGSITEVDNFLQLEAGAFKWEEGVDFLLVRDCYEKLYNKLVSAIQTESRTSEHWLLLGTPGIGKSLFGFYLIYKIVTSANNNNENIPSFVYSGREGKAVYLSYDEQPHIALYVNQEADYVISDTVPLSAAMNRMFNLHITSINNEGASTVNKYNSKNKLCMDVFSFKEYSILSKKVCVNSEDAELRFTYDIFGGCCRLLLANEDITLNSDLYGIVLNEIKFYFQDCFVEVTTKTRSNRTTNVVSKPITAAFEKSAQRCAIVISNLMSLSASNSSKNIESEATTRSLFMHKISVEENVWNDEWASRFLKSLAGLIMDKKAETVAQLLSKILGESAEGVVFERIAHKNVYDNLKCGIGYHIRNLNTNEVEKMEIKVHRKKLIRTIDDINKLAVGEYGLPVIPNFPVMDAIVGNYILQMTTAKQHNCASAKLDEICAIIPEAKLVNVLSKSNYDHFKPNKDVNIPQFKTLKDVQAGETTLSKNKNKRRNTQQEVEEKAKRVRK